MAMCHEPEDLLQPRQNVSPELAALHAEAAGVKTAEEVEALIDKEKAAVEAAERTAAEHLAGRGELGAAADRTNAGALRFAKYAQRQVALTERVAQVRLVGSNPAPVVTPPASAARDPIADQRYQAAWAATDFNDDAARARLADLKASLYGGAR